MARHAGPDARPGRVHHPGRHRARADVDVALQVSKSVAFKYASSRAPLVFNYKTHGLGRGCSIGYLSLYPKEEEYLYPPLTYLQPAQGAAAPKRVTLAGASFTVIDVEPRFPIM